MQLESFVAIRCGSCYDTVTDRPREWGREGRTTKRASSASKNWNITSQRDNVIKLMFLRVLKVLHLLSTNQRNNFLCTTNVFTCLISWGASLTPLCRGATMEVMRNLSWWKDIRLRVAAGESITYKLQNSIHGKLFLGEWVLSFLPPPKKNNQVAPMPLCGWPKSKQAPKKLTALLKFFAFIAIVKYI